MRQIRRRVMPGFLESLPSKGDYYAVYLLRLVNRLLPKEISSTDMIFQNKSTGAVSHGET